MAKRPYTILGERAALKYARALWGRTAHVETRPTCPRPEERYVVGMIELGLFFAVKGHGDSWDAAFDEAESLLGQRRP